MIVYRLKSENIVYDLYLPKKESGKVILYVPGLPGHPRKKRLGEAFACKGFTFFEMRFPGSWESDGVFTMDNCVKSLTEAYAFLSNGAGFELRKDQKITWKNEKIILMGNSFGGGVVLSSQLNDPLTFVLFSPVTKLGDVKHSLVKLASGEDDLFHLLKEGYRHAYRGLVSADWRNFLDGNTLINPERNVESLKNKELIFVQGDKDGVIQSTHTAEYVRDLKDKHIDSKLLTVTGAGHGSDLEYKAFQSVVKMLSR